MPAHPPRRRPASITAGSGLAALAVLTALAGCGGDAQESPVAEPSDALTTGAPAAPTGSPTASDGASASSSATASPSDGAGAAAASGPAVQGASFRLRAPEGWTIADPVSDFVRLATDPSGAGDIVVGFLEAADGATTDSLEDVAVQLWQGSERPTSHSRVEVDGVELYHLSGRSDTGGRLDEYGAEAGGLALSITFDLPEASPAERRAIIEAVLASLEWR